MRRIMALLCPVCCTMPLHAAAQVADLVAAPEFVDVELIRHVYADYPAAALQRQEEGWVAVSYIVSTQGEVIEPMIEGSSGVEAFERAALSAVRQWRYKPAMQDGVPVERGMVRTAIFFMLDDTSDGASREFVRAYRKISSLIAAKDLAAAGSALTDLELKPRRDFYEVAWLELLRYRYMRAAGTGSTLDLIDALTDAIWYDEQPYLERDEFVIAHQHLFILQARAGEFGAALETLSNLRKSKFAQRSKHFEPTIAEMTKAAADIQALIDGDAPLKVEGRVGKYAYWIHPLVRRSFSIVDVTGNLQLVDIRCTRGNKRYPFTTEDLTWTVPASWGDCGLYLHGERDTTFTFLEYPPDIAAAQPAAPNESAAR